MKINELDSISLSDYIKFHDTLNPVLWNENQNLHPQVRQALLAIADDFREFLGVNNIELKDITVSGSNAGYNYTDHSDIDLHLVVDLPEADRSQVYRELFDAKKYQYNDLHNITVGGYDVELYVQNANEPHYSQGIYSVLNDQWNIVPKKIKTNIDDDSVISKYQDLEHRINSAIAHNNLDKIQELIKKLKNMRSTGLAQQGEFSVENLTFKLLRSTDLIKQLYDRRNELHDQQLSLNERKKRRKTKKVRYGHGGYWYPGFSWSTDTAAGSEGGGGESINEQIDIKDNIKLFAKEIMDELGIVHRPKIILHSDPNWTVTTGSFGQYNPSDNQLQLAITNRHILDILRTLAHELVHCAQRHRGQFPDDAGETGSPYEDEANALAGRIMRGFADRRPELFQDIELSESSGYIPTEKEKNDPRFSTALTVDVRPGETGRQANKLKLNTDTQGHPELLLKRKKLSEEWSEKYKRSINCNNPRGFSQRAHCQGRKQHNENQDLSNNLTIYLDMDGVLADFAGRYRQMFGVEPQHHSRDDPNITKILGTDFFSRLDKFPTTDQVVELARKFGGGRYNICSSPLRGDHSNSSENKKQWLLNNLQPLPSRIIFTRNKEKYALTNDRPNVLIDDKPSNIAKWRKAGGHGIYYDAQRHDINYLNNELENLEHQYIQALQKTGLDTTDIDPVDPKQPKGMKRQKVDPTYNVSEVLNTKVGKKNAAKWEHKADEGSTLKFVASNGLNYRLDIMPMWLGADEAQPWEFADITEEQDQAGVYIEFSQNDPSNWMSGKKDVTGTGSAAEIFGIVTNAILQYIKKVKPPFFMFQAAEINRRRLYNAILKAFLPRMPNYNVIGPQKDGIYFVYDSNVITPNKQGVAEALSWSSLDKGLSLENKMAIFEEYAVRGNLTESIDQDQKDYFISLSELADTPIKNKKYIVVPLALVGNKIMPLDNPAVMLFLGQDNNSLVFDTASGKKTYPSKAMRDLSVFNTFTFASYSAYEKFRTALSLKFDVDLPLIDIEQGVSRGSYSISDFKINAHESMADFRKWMRSPKKNDRGMTRRIVDMYENIVVKDNILKEANQTFIKRQQQAKTFSDDFKQFDKREKVQIKLGNKIALLSSTVIPDDNSSRIELSGFITPKKIVKINSDSEGLIDSIKFDDGSIFPEASEFTTVGGIYITNTIFFPDDISAAKAYTSIWMLISNLEGQGWKIENYMNKDLPENFADGRNPGRRGLSRRVGIPKKATLGQLEKIAKSSTGERRRMAQWQLNMRRGKKK